jgi:hypothetical protein
VGRLLPFIGCTLEMGGLFRVLQEAARLVNVAVTQQYRSKSLLCLALLWGGAISSKGMFLRKICLTVGPRNRILLI